jgi:hypothetical protein
MSTIDFTSPPWDQVQTAVEKEHDRVTVAAKFLTPPVTINDQSTFQVITDKIDEKALPILTVDPHDFTNIIEIFVTFSLPSGLADNPADVQSAVTLAIGAANLLALAEDKLIFKGEDATKDELFTSGLVSFNNRPQNIIGMLPADQKFSVEPVEENSDPKLNSYGENIYAAVAKGYALLQDRHGGRQALVLPTTVYADTYAARGTTLEIPAITADRLKGLIKDWVNGTTSVPGVYGTSTVPDFAKTDPAKGVLVALDGNTMDLVVQMPPTVELLPQKDANGNPLFKVKEKFALRLKDRKAVVEFDFSPKKTSKTTK